MAAEGLGIDLGDSMIDSGQDPSEIKNRVLAYLNATPETDGRPCKGDQESEADRLAEP